MSDNKPVPNATVDMLFDVAKALETRIDYNFNSMIQLSLLVEYLYEQLDELNIKIPMDETFEKFQKQRLEEIQNNFDSAMEEAKLKATEENLKNSNVKLEDD